MKKTDCPLCNAAGVIVYNEPETVTNVHPVHHSLGAVHVGNYTQGFQGGGYDWSHAEVCPLLSQAHDKKGLLAFYVGSPEILVSDFFIIDDYEEAVSEVDLQLEVIMKRAGEKNNKKWLYIAYISWLNNRLLETTSSDPDTAFAFLKHRLRCGDIIHAKGKRFQLANTVGKLAFQQI